MITLELHSLSTPLSTLGSHSFTSFFSYTHEDNHTSTHMDLEQSKGRLQIIFGADSVIVTLSIAPVPSHNITHYFWQNTKGAYLPF